MSSYLDSLIFSAAQNDGVVLDESSKKSVSVICEELAHLRLNESLNLCSERLKVGKGDDIMIHLLLKGEVLLYAEQYLLAVTNFYEAMRLLDDSSIELKAYLLQGLSSASRFAEDYSKAIEYADEGLQLQPAVAGTKIKLRMSKGISQARSGKVDEAFTELNSCIRLAKESGIDYLVTSCVKALGDLYVSQNNAEAAMNCFNEAVDYARQVDHYVLLTMIYNRRGKTYLALGKEDLALADFDRALLLTKKHGFVSGEQITNALLGDYYAKKEDFKKAFEHQIRAKELEEQLHRQKSSADHQRVEMEYFIKLKDEEIILLQTVAEKHKELEDSLKYARNVQNALLPASGFLNEQFKDGFVFYEPKETVGGDFYWYSNSEDRLIVIAADCTGHGVPGAMVSMLCSNAITKVVESRPYESAGRLLDEINNEVINAFNKNENDDAVRDGMDLSVVVIDHTTNQVECAGANNPVLRIASNELIEYDANRQSIGALDATCEAYDTHKFERKSGDWIYLFSDGFQDQFGGPKGKKFMARNFKRLLQELNSKPGSDQYSILKETLESWSGDNERVDDILVIGIQL